MHRNTFGISLIAIFGFAVTWIVSQTWDVPCFCPHSVFMCFVWIWEQTTVISLYCINWLVFITETECVYCAVRTGSLFYSCETEVFLAGLSPWKPEFQPGPLHVVFVVTSVCGKFFCESSGFSLVGTILPLLDAHRIRTNGPRLGTFKRIWFFFGIGSGIVFEVFTVNSEASLHYLGSVWLTSVSPYCSFCLSVCLLSVCLSVCLSRCSVYKMFSARPECTTDTCSPPL